MFVTLDVFHAEMSWLKEKAYKNLSREGVGLVRAVALFPLIQCFSKQGTHIWCIVVTLDVSHADMF